MQLGAEAAVLAVGTVSEDRRRRQLPAGRLLAEAGGKLGLRLEADRVRDLRLPPSLQVVAPLMGQVKAPAERQRPPLADRVQRDRDLAVADLAERAIVATTNLMPDELSERLGARTVSRLVEICGDLIPLYGEDRRREFRPA